MIPPPDSYVQGWNIFPNFGRDTPGGDAPANTLPIDNVNDYIAPVKNVPRIAAVAAPMMGPVDAPHLRYIPSYFSQQLPDRIARIYPTILSTFHSVRTKMYAVLWYKPPVGIVSVWSCMRILEKVYGVWSPPPPTSGEEALADAEGRVGNSLLSSASSSLSKTFSPWGNIGKIYTSNVQQLGLSKEQFQQQQKLEKMRTRRKTRRKKVRNGRSFDLDGGDRSYEDFGGVETVRVRACQEGLKSALLIVSEKEPSSADKDNNNNANKGISLFGAKKNDKNLADSRTDQQTSKIDYSKDIQVALAALKLSIPPKGSREYFVEKSADALSNLSHYLTTSNNRNNKEPAPSIEEQNIELLLRHSAKLIELRTIDALLRTLRDRHLIVASRLRRSQTYWKWHVNLSGGILGRLLSDIRQQLSSVLPLANFKKLNKRKYERVTAALERETLWLGKVERSLLERPAEMDISELLTVTDENKQRKKIKNRESLGDDEGWTSRLQNMLGAGNGSNEGNVNGKSSRASLAASTKFLIQSKNRMWIRDTETWTKQARVIVKNSLVANVGSSFIPIRQTRSNDEINNDPDEENETIAYVETRFLEKWATYDDTASDADSWLSVLSLVDYAASSQRAGEQRYFQLSNFAARIKRYDFLGIPSSALLLAAANSLHDKIIAKHSGEIVDFAKAIFNAVKGIFVFRFYTPMKDIVLDLLNRRPRMVDPFALLNEQTSLDNMLKDLGVGDGTRLSRTAALAAASRMYEEEVSGGAIRGIVRGKVAQLMLIQIQQLKADLLQAMDQIDNLVDANRLNVQLVASIPAVLIFIYGTRALFLFWSNIRMKDLRLPKDVHSEMSDFLKKIEECLVMANYEMDDSFSSTTVEESDTATEPGSSMKHTFHRREAATNEVSLAPKEMGQLLLLLHSYLNLLDYMSPPFPSKQCDSIHHSVQNMLMQGHMSTTRQLDLLRVIQAKHTGLLKSL